MLVLARRFGESIDIGDIRIKVIGRRGGEIVIGIDAPRGVRVRRSELPVLPVGSPPVDRAPQLKH